MKTLKLTVTAEAAKIIEQMIADGEFSDLGEVAVSPVSERDDDSQRRTSQAEQRRERESEAELEQAGKEIAKAFAEGTVHTVTVTYVDVQQAIVRLQVELPTSKQIVRREGVIWVDYWLTRDQLYPRSEADLSKHISVGQQIMARVITHNP